MRRLAEKAGLSQPMISYVERGMRIPTLETVLRIAHALDVTARFGLKAATAKTILREVLTAVSAWRRIGGKLRLKASTLDTYASAFEHKLTDEARRLLKQ